MDEHKQPKRMFEKSKISPAKIGSAVLIFAIAAVAIAYRLLVSNNLDQSAAFYIGLPTLLALVLILLPNPRSFTGIMLKAVTLLILASAILLREGFICILFTAPLFYAVAVIIGLVVDWGSKRSKSSGPPDSRLYGLIVLPFLVMSLEGVVPATTIQRANVVTVERVVAASPTEIANHLAAPSDFSAELPAFLRIGFPTPGVSTGSGLAVGDQRVIPFLAGEHSGELVLEVTVNTGKAISLRAVSDTSPIANWLAWQKIDIQLTEVSPGQTLVTWTVEFERLLDPAWYFGFWERLAVREAAGYLITALATP